MKRFRIFVFLSSLSLSIFAQFPYGTTGLLHMPTADMQRDKTFMLGGSYLHEQATPPGWDYPTYNYYINITMFPFFEVGYTCTLFKFAMPGLGLPEKYRNQDRQFSVRLRAIKEGQFWQYMPAVVVGGNDFLTSAKLGENGYSTPSELGNGHWNRWYLAATKHFNLYGELGLHVAYVYNDRLDYPLNGVALGVNWSPRFHAPLNVMAEYDSRRLNCGLGYRIWKDHINIVTELTECKYPSVGVYFKVHLK